MPKTFIAAGVRGACRPPVSLPGPAGEVDDRMIAYARYSDERAQLYELQA